MPQVAVPSFVAAVVEPDTATPFVSVVAPAQLSLAGGGAWMRIVSLDPADSGAREAALQGVISALSDHPFALSQPELVRQVAEFRLRLLQR